MLWRILNHPIAPGDKVHSFNWAFAILKSILIHLRNTNKSLFLSYFFIRELLFSSAEETLLNINETLKEWIKNWQLKINLIISRSRSWKHQNGHQYRHPPKTWFLKCCHLIHNTDHQFQKSSSIPGSEWVWCWLRNLYDGLRSCGIFQNILFLPPPNGSGKHEALLFNNRVKWIGRKVFATF